MRKIILLVILSIFLVSACAQKQMENPDNLVGHGSDVPGQETASSQQEAVQEASQPEAPQPTDAAKVKEFKITARQFSFEPGIIEVNEGDKVRLVITSMDIPHGFSITEYGINKRLDVGKPATIEFTADKKGTFTAFCSVFCGSGHGNMKGKLIVK